MNSHWQRLHTLATPAQALPQHISAPASLAPHGDPVRPPLATMKYPLAVQRMPGGAWGTQYRLVIAFIIRLANAHE